MCGLSFFAGDLNKPFKAISRPFSGVNAGFLSCSRSLLSCKQCFESRKIVLFENGFQSTAFFFFFLMPRPLILCKHWHIAVPTCVRHGCSQFCILWSIVQQSKCHQEGKKETQVEVTTG